MADCLTNLLSPEVQKALFGDQKVPKAAIEKLLADIRDLRANADKMPELGTYETRLQKYIKDQMQQVALEKGRAALKRTVSRKATEFLNQPAFYENPREGILAFLSGARTLAEGGKDSIDANQTAIRYDHENMLIGGLKDAGVLELVQSGKLDQEIQMAEKALSRGTKMPDVSTEARKAAEIFHQVHRSMFIATRDAGIPVRELVGYTGAMLDNLEKVRAEGADSWIKKVRAFGIDKEATFGTAAGDVDKENKILKKIYESKSWGKTSADGPPPAYESVVPGVNYDKKLAATRSLRLTDEGEIAYKKEFGRDGLLATEQYDIQRKARMIGLTRKLGPNPQAMLEEVIAKQKAIYMDAGRSDLAHTLDVSTDTFRNVLGDLTGKSNIPGLNMRAKITDGIKTWQAVAHLAWAGINSLPNFGIAAMQLRNMTGTSYLDAIGKIFHTYAKDIPGGQLDKTLRLVGLAAHDQATGMFGDHEAWQMPGVGSKLMKWQMKYNLMDGVNKVQGTMALLYGVDLADHVNGSWEELHPQMQAQLMQTGIGKADFPFLKQAVETAEHQGENINIVTPEAFKNIDPKDPQVIARASELKMTPEQYVNDLRLKYHSSLIAAGNNATTSSTARERTATTWGKSKGTNARMALDLIMQFKQFYVQSMNIEREVLNSRPDMAALSQGVLKSGDTNYADAAKLAAMSMGLGYVSMLTRHYVTDAAKATFKAATGFDSMSHAEEIDPRSPWTWVNAINRGGSYAPIMDAMLGQAGAYGGWSKSILGPTFGGIVASGIDEIQQAHHDLANGKPLDKVAAEGGKVVARIIRQNMPFGQAPLLKQGYDYALLKTLDTLSPGYANRARMRLEAQKARAGR